MVRKSDISTPEGYFDDLQERLSQIPRQKNRPGMVRLLAPYAAIAASMVLAVLIGNFILRRTAAPAEEDAGWEYISYLAQSLDPDGILPPLESEPLTGGDIAAFLIEEGISVEQLNAYYDEEAY